MNKKINDEIEREIFETLSKCYEENPRLISSMEKILSKNININYQDKKNGCTFLMVTIENNLPILFNLILKYRPLLDIKNANGKTATHYAAKSSNNDYLTKLIQVGSNLNVHDKSGNTPINEAIQSCIIPNIKTLIDNEAVLNFLNYRGLSIYDIAYLTGNPEVIEFISHYPKKDKNKKGPIRRLFHK